MLVKIFFYALSCRRNGPRLLQNSWSQRTSQLNTRGVTEVNILLHWMSVALATVQARLVFTPYLTHKKQKERDLGWTKVHHWPRIIWKMDSGVCSTHFV